ncbi:MAG: flagellin [Phycisphaerales bacterium]|nr:flagellin [Phycisphaerales bacterium]
MSVGFLSSIGMFQGFGLSQLRVHQDSIGQSLERLSTGKRINRASDDPSAMIAANGMKAQRYALEKRLDSFERETSWLGAREGALSVMSDFMVELSGLVVQAGSSDAMSEEEREGIRVQIEGIITGINHVAGTTTFGGEQVLVGFSASELGVQSAKPTSDEEGNPVAGERVSLADLPRLISEDSGLAQDVVESAGTRVSGQRGVIGNRLKSIDAEKSALAAEFENINGAISMIEDADFAKETAELVRSQILEQATISAIQIGRENAARILDLITPMPQSKAI